MVLRARAVLRGATLAGSLALVVCDRAALAQSVSLRDALLAASRSPPVQLADSRRAGIAGELTRQRGALDWAVDASASHQRARCFEGAEFADDRSVLQLGVGRIFQNGMRVEAGLTGERSTCAPALGADVMTGRIGAALTVPLLRGRALGAPIDAASIALAAGTHEVAFARAQSMLAAALAYWDLVAARLRFDALTRAEALGQQLLDNTQALVTAREAPASDLSSLRASQAERVRARVVAAQAMLEARYALALAMGYDAPAAAALGSPASPFATPPRELPEVSALYALALARREDLAALGLELEAAARRIAFVQNAAQARVDLEGRLQYTLSNGGAGAAIAQDNPGLYAGLTLTVDAPIENRQRVGALQVQLAEAAQLRVRRDDAVRRVRLAIDVRRADLARLAEALRLAEAARDAYAQARDNEAQRAVAGLSTLLDVIILQDRAVAAELEVIGLSAQRAQVFSFLLFEVGALRAEDRLELVLPGTTAPAAGGGP